MCFVDACFPFFVDCHISVHCTHAMYATTHRKANAAATGTEARASTVTPRDAPPKPFGLRDIKHLGGGGLSLGFPSKSLPSRVRKETTALPATIPSAAQDDEEGLTLIITNRVTIPELD